MSGNFKLPSTDTPPDNTYFDNQVISWDFVTNGNKATLGAIQPGFNEIFPVSEGGEQIVLQKPEDGAALFIDELDGNGDVEHNYVLEHDGDEVLISGGKNMRVSTAGKIVEYVCVYPGQPVESVFGDRDFTLTTDDVADVRKERAADVAEREAILADPDEDDRIKRSVERGLNRTKAEAKFFREGTDEDILEIAKTVFERGQALEASGLTKEAVVSAIYEELPEAGLMYQLLRKNPWGYKLGSAKTALDTNRRGAAAEQ